jgi:hypothetical protein
MRGYGSKWLYSVSGATPNNVFHLTAGLAFARPPAGECDPLCGSALGV